uniref:Uncharacterized protein n=1 Tax=Anguilla anguilla TaxID=7936 RepID=A0A0E9WZV9_ANGAN
MKHDRQLETKPIRRFLVATLMLHHSVLFKISGVCGSHDATHWLYGYIYNLKAHHS